MQQTVPVNGVEDLVALLPSPEGGSRLLLGIAGTPGSGKSMLAAALVGVRPATAHVPMDGFHLADQALIRLGLLNRKGAPETFDAHGYAALLSRLRSTPAHTVYTPAFERDLEQPLANALPVAPSVTLVVTEGNYLLLDRPGWREARNQLAEVWFLDVEPGVRRHRLIERHIRFGKHPADAARWVREVDEPNAELVEGARATASRILDCSGWQAS